MLIQYHQEKLINAIVYFAKNTHNCGKTKLFKLLYFLDFEHFKQTGRSVTGLDYYAWKMGPVPPKLHEEFSKEFLELDTKYHIHLVPKKIGNYEILTIEPITNPDLSYFSKRELSIIEQLSKEYKTTTTKDMIENTHLPNLPWHKVFHEERREYQLIPYEYAIHEAHKDIIHALSQDSMEIKNNYSETLTSG